MYDVKKVIFVNTCLKDFLNILLAMHNKNAGFCMKN